MIEQEPRFPNIGKELPYTVPTDFFDTLPGRTLQLAKEREVTHRRKTTLIRFFTLITSAAAVILLFVIPSHRDLTQKTTTSKAESIDEILQGMSDEDLSQQSSLYSAEDLENSQSPVNNN